MENHKETNAVILKFFPGKLPGMAIVASLLFINTHLYAEKVSSDPGYSVSFLNQSWKNSDPGKIRLDEKGLHPVIVSTPKGYHVRIHDGDITVFSSLKGDAGLLLVQPSGTTPIGFKGKSDKKGIVSLYGGKSGGLEISETYNFVTPSLIERTVTVKASSDQRYFLNLGWKAAHPGSFYSFTGEEKSTVSYSPGTSGPEFGAGNSMQTFPFLGVHSGKRLYGIIGDTPGKWENRSFIGFDIENRCLSIENGDGSERRTIEIPHSLDSKSVYRGSFDGWQHIEQGETQNFKTWIFSSDAVSLYDIQLAAHLALANAMHYNESGLEAILRNTSYLLLRRNFLRPESDYIFISGVGYGWKQWVSDAFYMSRGLDDVVYDREAFNSVFFERIEYEDNAQYYLIWSALVKRAGGSPDMRTVRRAYQFIRDHESDGLYIPPAVTPGLKINKTYHDQLPYDDDDAPSSDQGFHCGALIAARELGFEVNDRDIEKAIEGYRRMFNKEGGYMATSLKQQEYIGQDALYGEVLTYAVFGIKLLPDEIVKKHIETSIRLQSPYGMRIISKANGDLLEGHTGVYTNGGSWFLNDACNYLDGLIHGMDPGFIDNNIIRRLEKELAWMPAFHESISTVTGKPHGHHLYSWNSGYLWLRREVRRRLGFKGPDLVEEELDKELGIVHRNGYLELDPSSATLRPAEQSLK